MGSVTAPERAEDTVAMAKIVFGDDFVENNTVTTSLINANSPMVFDETMLGALKVYARHNQASVVSPFILSGANSLDIWLAPIPIANYGYVAQSFRVNELTGVRFTSLFYSEAVAIPVL